MYSTALALHIEYLPTLCSCRTQELTASLLNIDPLAVITLFNDRLPIL